MLTHPSARGGHHELSRQFPIPYIGVATMNYQDEYATSDIAIIAPDFNYKNDWMIKTYAQGALTPCFPLLC